MSSRSIVKKCTSEREKDKGCLLFFILISLRLQDIERSRPVPRGPVICRRRWDSDRFLDLAVKEGSFLQEYRMNIKEFRILFNLLEPYLQRNEKMAKLRSGDSGLITAMSRLGVALIILGGGRNMEAMRTHGIAASSVLPIFYDVLEAINSCPLLALPVEQDIFTLTQRAAGFKAKSKHGLFDFCVGAVDGMVIPIRAPRNSETTNQTAFYSEVY